MKPIGNWTDQSCWYVSVINPQNPEKKALLLGPYRTPEDALADVRYATELADEVDCRAAFYAFGTAKCANGHRGALFTRERPLWDGRSITMRRQGYTPNQYVSIGA